MAIIQNGSSLFTGDAGSGASEIRRYVITEDLVEAIVQLPTDLFYNTGISTYIWLISKNKADERKGKIQLIDASKCFEKRRKNIGNKRVDLSSNCIDLIVNAYNDFSNDTYQNGDLSVESKVFDNDYFGYTKVTVLTPILDENGQPILKKGKPQPDKAKTDTESIPLNENIDEFIKRMFCLIMNLLILIGRKIKSVTKFRLQDCFINSYRLLRPRIYLQRSKP